METRTGSGAVTSEYHCLSCGWTGSHRRCIWVYRTGENSSFGCPECYAAAFGAELEDAWPDMPDLEDGIDRFSQYPVTGEES